MRENKAHVVDLTAPARASTSSLGKRQRVVDLTREEEEEEAPASTEYWEDEEEEESSPYFRSLSSSQPEAIGGGGRFQGRRLGDLGGNVNDGDGYVPFVSSQDSAAAGEFLESPSPEQPLSASQRFRNAIEAAILGAGPGPATATATRSGGDVVYAPQEPTIKLTPDQNRVLQLVLEGKNVFFTGPVKLPLPM
jgi:hypothetical protein